MPLAFGNCELDLERRELCLDGTVVHTRAKVFDILSYLVVNRDRVLSRDELLTHGWPDLNISDATLRSCMLSVRRAVGDDVQNPRYIKTLRGKGFRFIAEVTEHGTPNREDAYGAPIIVRENGLSVAILPFANLNKDPKLDYLADGLAEDIITELSCFKGFTVIARNSSFQYGGLADDIKKIGSELGVDYVLEGSVRYASDLFRATAQLIQASTTKHIWAESYDGRIENLLTLQDDISRQIVTNIAPEIDHAETRRAPKYHASDLRAQELAWQARALLDRARSEGKSELYSDSLVLAEAAVAQDSSCRQGWWTISCVNFLTAFSRQGKDPDAWLARSREAAEKLRALDRNDHSAYMALGWVSYIERDHDRALTNLNHAHDLNPNCTMTLMFLGTVVTSAGKAQEGYLHLSRARRLSPRDFWLGFMLAAQGLACFALENYEEGINLSRQAIEREPFAPANHVILAGCLAELGDMEGAGAAIRSQRKVNDTFLQEYLEGKRLPFLVPEIAKRYAAALNRAANAAEFAARI